MKTPKLVTVSRKVTDNVKTGAAARAFREQNGLSLRDLAAKMGDGYGFSMLARLEAGQRAWTAKSFDLYVKSVKEISKL